MEIQKIEDYDGPDKVLDANAYLAASDAQTACNLSGITHSFGRIVSSIWTEATKRGKGTAWVNQHPISVLFATQIAHLSGHTTDRPDSVITYQQASEYCQTRAELAQVGT